MKLQTINLDASVISYEWEAMAHEILSECTGRMHAERTVDAIATSTLYALLAQHAPIAYSLTHQKTQDPELNRVTVTLWHAATHGHRARLLRGISFALEWTAGAH